jgi:hypothetical protein
LTQKACAAFGATQFCEVNEQITELADADDVDSKKIVKTPAIKILKRKLFIHIKAVLRLSFF